MNAGGGSYNDWPYYASPSSNLSALAAPFSVNRSFSDVVSSPFMDSSVSADSSVVPSILSPLHPPNYGYDFFSDPARELDSTPSSKPYGYSGFLEPSSSKLAPRSYSLVPSMDSFSFDQNPNSSKPSAVEAQPYYPSYVPSSVHDQAPSVAPFVQWPSSPAFSTTLAGSSTGDYANKSPELVGFTGYSYSMWSQFGELNQGKSLQVRVGSSFSENQMDFSDSAVEEMMEQGCQDVQDSINGDVSNVIGWEKHNVPMNADQVDHESLWWGPIKPMPTEFSSSSVTAPSYVSLESNGKDACKVPDSGNCHLSCISSYDKYLREHDEHLRIDPVCSRPITTDLNIGNIITHGDLGKKSIYDFKESYHPNPGTAGCFAISQFHMHPERNQSSPSNNAVTSGKNISTDVVDYIFKEIQGFQDSHANLDNLTLRLSSNGNVNSVEKSIDGADRCNPAVDSPCWKGSPADNFFRYALPPEYLHKNEKYFGSVIQVPQSFQVDTDLAGSTRKFSVEKFASENCNFDGADNTGTLQSESTCDYAINCLNGMTVIKENNVPSSKSYDCESGSSHCEEEISLSSISPVEDGLTTVEKSAEKVSSAKCIVRTLVDRMQSLSEILLMQLSNDPCELKEEDCSALKNVISSLNTCVLKNDGQITLSQEPQPATSRSSGQSCKLQLNASFEKLQVSQVEPESSKVEHENPLVQDAKNLPSKFKILVKKPSDSISLSGDAETKQEDDMTKALKRILSKNFNDDEGVESHSKLYKNLWLEAEAALCSINYKARYNKIKIEMERYKQKAMEEQSSLSKSQSSATKVHTDTKPDVNQPNTFTPEEKSGQAMDNFIQNSTFSVSNTEKEAGDDEASVLARFHVLKARGDMSCMNPEGKSGQAMDNFIQNSTFSVSDTEKEAGDDGASVLARFHVLKARGGMTSMNTVNVEEPSNTALSSPRREGEGQNQVNICHDSPTSCPIVNKVDDYEACVMARFRILKSRVEDSSSMPSEYKLLDVCAGKGAEEASVMTTALEGHSFDVNVNPSEMYFSSYTALDESISKELHVDLEDHEEIEPCRTNQFESQLATDYSDALSLDWEHVEEWSL